MYITREEAITTLYDTMLNDRAEIVQRSIQICKEYFYRENSASGGRERANVKSM